MLAELLSGTQQDDLRIELACVGDGEQGDGDGKLKAAWAATAGV